MRTNKQREKEKEKGRKKEESEMERTIDEEMKRMTKERKECGCSGTEASYQRTDQSLIERQKLKRKKQLTDKKVSYDKRRLK